MTPVYGICKCALCESRRIIGHLALVKSPEPRHAWPYSEALDALGPAPYEGKRRADVSS